MIPFVDLKAQYQNIREEIDGAIKKVFETNQFILGDEVAAFEEEFARYCGSSFAIAVNSGTSALHLALLAAGIGPGDEVITVPFTFIATVAAIVYSGARPIFVDIDPKSFTMDVDQIERAITERTKVILPVHLYGQPADMERILEIARRHHLLVIEDAAQAHGSEDKGRRVGGLGDIGCFSFYPGKNLGAYGEGGMVVTNNSIYAQTLRLLRDWGQIEKGHHILKGYNYRMEGIQGAVLRVKLRYLEAWTEARRLHAKRYHELLKRENIETPEERSDCRHVYHIYAIRVGQRDALQRVLRDRDIQTGIHYPIPVHLQEGYRDLGYRWGDFPNSEKAASSVLSLPMYAELKESQIEEICQTVIDFLKKEVGKDKRSWTGF